MEKAYQLSEKIINDINEYSQKYIGEEGKYVNTPDSIELLNCIIEEGFTLHKYMCEKENNEQIESNYRPVSTPEILGDHALFHLPIRIIAVP